MSIPGSHVHDETVRPIQESEEENPRRLLAGGGILLENLHPGLILQEIKILGLIKPSYQQGVLHLELVPVRFQYLGT